ncbi:MAG: hypothetical protein Q4Q23_01125 [Methanobacteriaceae archaeon]|nr:hypothetical protein [Methanobacteriaceae archaeon]
MSFDKVKNNHLEIKAVKISGVGKCSVKVEDDNLIMKPLEIDYDSEIVPFSKIVNLSYDAGNFIIEPKIKVTTNQITYNLKGVNDNDSEMMSFYTKLKSIKRESYSKRLNLNDDIEYDIEEDIYDHKQEETSKKSLPTINKNYNNQLAKNFSKNTSQDTNKEDPTEEIRKYHKLKEDKIITEEEFNKKKKELLKL